MKTHPWALEELTDGDLSWTRRQMSQWQVQLIVEQCQRYRKLFLKWIHGFTLVEVMVVISVIGILSAAAVPVLKESLRRSYESATKAHLTMLRHALLRYQLEHGTYPTDFQQLIAGGFISKIPPTKTPPYHPGGNVVGMGTMTEQGANTGNWYFFNSPNEARYGQLIVNCNHTTLQNQPWDSL
jgi:type II secretion system protein G